MLFVDLTWAERRQMLAFELKQPFRLLKVVQEMLQLGENAALNALVASFTSEQVCLKACSSAAVVLQRRRLLARSRFGRM